MLFNKITPERAGVKSSAVRKYIKTVQKRDIPLHSLLMMKGEDIFCECYWKPYTVDSNHRMYSQTKSYVSIAIGLLEEDGKLSLSDKIADHFPEKIKGPVSEFVSNLTIEELSDFVETVPLGRMGTAEEIAQTIFFLASDQADYITGQVIGVNGGYVI